VKIIEGVAVAVLAAGMLGAGIAAVSVPDGLGGTHLGSTGQAPDSHTGGGPAVPAVVRPDPGAVEGS
jgi:hypothetical protein